MKKLVVNTAKVLFGAFVSLLLLTIVGGLYFIMRVSLLDALIGLIAVILCSFIGYVITVGTFAPKNV